MAEPFRIYAVMPITLEKLRARGELWCAERDEMCASGAREQQ